MDQNMTLMFNFHKESKYFSSKYALLLATFELFQVTRLPIMTLRYANSTESIELAYLDGFRRVFSSGRFSGYSSGYADLGIAVDQFRRLRPKPNIISTVLIWASKTSGR